MKVIYIAGKYTGKTHGPESYIEISRNILTAREWAIKVMKLGGCIAFTPHLNSAYMECDFNQPVDFWYQGDIEIMKRCDAVFLIPNWVESTGAKAEFDAAIKHRLPCFEDLSILRAWLDRV